MYKKFYQNFINANPGVQHYAAHSHHYWPDVTREATLQYWDDSAKYVDEKWDYFFSTKVPQAQTLISDVLNLSNPEQIVFAPNTHEFVFRLLSCLDFAKTNHILTTDSEFHSFDRQINRLSESSNFKVEKLATWPFADFTERLIQKIESKNYDMIFLSQVFFNSGLVVADLERIVAAVKNSNTLIIIDGYHGFMAVPTDLKNIEDRIFYMAGSYKYAQGGEGCCFMHVPKNCELRPLYTGWFAGFSELTVKNNLVSYSCSGMRFAGSTMDLTGLYRLIATLQLFKTENINVTAIHTYIQKQQAAFREYLTHLKFDLLNVDCIIQHDFSQHGHFYAFKMKDVDQAKTVHDLLASHQIKTDYRGDRLRFGFGLYQDPLNLNSLVRK